MLEKRLQIQIDAATHAALRRRAFERGCSMASAVREVLVEALKPPGSGRKAPDARLMGIVGIGASPQQPDRPVSGRHDEALIEAYSHRFRRSTDDDPD